jgi:hypothetical protein
MNEDYCFWTDRPCRLARQFNRPRSALARFKSVVSKPWPNRTARSLNGRIAMRAIGWPSLLFDAGSLKPRFNRRNAGIDLLLRQFAE